ncbi:MAG: hypothetical protein PHI40_04700 [Caldisericia bacterium]|nr:hypothetical protein [Caldisericia bacterium]MDD4614692.1 hypothetical protein [Caldisericia bacterium]
MMQDQLEEKKNQQQNVQSSQNEPLLKEENEDCHTAKNDSQCSTTSSCCRFRWVGVVIMSIVVLFFFSFLLYLVIPSPSKTVRNFFYALMNENYPVAYSYIAKDYKKSRGALDKFSSDYDTAVRSGTRTRAIRVIENQKTKEKNQRIIVVEIDVFYQGSLVTSVGAYLCERIPGDGWKIVENVTTEYNKNQAQKLVPQQ